METPASEFLPSKPAGFLVSQASSNSLGPQSVIKFSETNSAFLWEIDPLSGMFKAQKTATYMFVLSGASAWQYANIGLYLKSSTGSATNENLEQNILRGGSFNRMFVRQLKAGDEISLKVESSSSHSIGLNTPLIFYCTEIM